MKRIKLDDSSCKTKNGLDIESIAIQELQGRFISGAFKWSRGGHAADSCIPKQW